MRLKPGYLSERSGSRERVTAVLSDEIKNHMFIYAALMIMLSLAGDMPGDGFATKKGAFVLAVILFSAFSALLEYCIRLVRNGLLPTMLSVIPGAISAYLLRQQEDITYLAGAIILSICIRLLIGVFPFWEKTVLYGSFVLTAAAVFLNVCLSEFSENNGYELFMFVCLVTLSLCSLQQLLIERGKTAFPFSYFLILSVFLILIPVNDEPIDWTGVIRAGQKIAQGADYAISSVSYFFTDVLDIKMYSTGYSSLTNLGGNARESKTAELFLHTREKPYVLFEDPASGEMMKRKRVVYLTGGRGIDKEAIVDFLLMLQTGQVTGETAKLFSHMSDVNVEYAYLRTKDEIVPAHSLILSSNGKRVEDGQSKKTHKKGYEIRARYLDIDYGSRHLTEIIKSIPEEGHMDEVSYDVLSEYAWDTYGFNLSDVVKEDEYETIIENSALLTGYRSLSRDKERAEYDLGEYTRTIGECIDVSGAGVRLRDLAHEITKDYDNDYDKCRAIEEYLRHYTYSLQVSEDNNMKADMTTAEGMSRLAEAFLFETEKGYCIHYASAMVMMLRLCGIPARAAFGFCYLYPFDEEVFYTVEGNCAHAWPEAYISNVGWVPFEPTSAYPTAMNLSWNRAPKNDGDSVGGTYYKGPAVKMNGEDDSDEELPGAKDKDALSKENDPSGRIIYITVSLMLLGAALFILIILFTAVARKLRYRLGTDDEKLQISVEQIKKLIRRYSGESFPDRGFLSDYLGRAPDGLRPDIEKTFDAYYALLYGKEGKKSVSAEDVERAREVTLMWKSVVRKKQ